MKCSPFSVAEWVRELNKKGEVVKLYECGQGPRGVIYHSEEWIEGKLFTRESALDLVCAVPTGSVCLPSDVPGELTIPEKLSVPTPSPMPTKVTEEDEKLGIGSEPERVDVTKKASRTKNLTAQQLREIYSQGTTSPSVSPTEAEKIKAEKGETAPSPTYSPTYNYVNEKSPNNVNGPTGTTEPPAEPEAPLFTAPEETIVLPNFAVGCSSFPFGVPCWVVELIKSWSASGVAPSVTVPIGGHSTVIKLAGIEPEMEVVRPVFAIAAIVGLVLTFFSFGMGGGGGGSGGGDD